MKNKRKTAKRLLAALLSCSMLTGLAAMPAAAANLPSFDLLVVGITNEDDPDYILEEIYSSEVSVYEHARLPQSVLDSHIEGQFRPEIGDVLHFEGPWVFQGITWPYIVTFEDNYPDLVSTITDGGHSEDYYEKQRLAEEGEQTEYIAVIGSRSLKFTASPYVGHVDRALYFTGFEKADARDDVKAQVLTVGDLDGSGEADIMDAILLNKSLVGGLTLTDDQKAAADLDGSGSIDTTDGLLLLKAVVGLA